MTLPHFQIEGHVYYVTIVVYGRLTIFTHPAYIIPLLDSLNYYRNKHRFKLLGYVVMPDHLHLLIWPYGESTMSDIMRDFKRFTSGRIARQAQVEGNSAWLEAFRMAGEATHRAEYKVWQDDYWDESLYSEHMLRQKLNYMHQNPVRADLVEHPGDYPYSSYRNYVEGNETLIKIDMGWQ